MWQIIYIIEDWWVHPLSGSSQLLWIRAFTGKAYRILNEFWAACDGDVIIDIRFICRLGEKCGRGVTSRATDAGCRHLRHPVCAVLAVPTTGRIINPTRQPPSPTLSYLKIIQLIPSFTFPVGTEILVQLLRTRPDQDRTSIVRI